MNFKIITSNGYVIYVPFCRDSCLKMPIGKRKKQPSNKQVHKTSVKKQKNVILIS
jgi:hypothetical protein